MIRFLMINLNARGDRSLKGLLMVSIWLRLMADLGVARSGRCTLMEQSDERFDQGA